MAFNNDVVGGTTLLRVAIQSANYVPGVSGWSINRDGSAEFATGTFRGPVVVIDPLTGNVLASIGANGNGSFQNVYATGDVIIGTLSVLAAITAAGRGVVARITTSSLPAVTGNSVLANICWIAWDVDPTRQYLLRCDVAYIAQINSTLAENFVFKLVVAQTGGLNATVYSNTVDIKPSAPIIPVQSFLLPAFTSGGPATIAFQASNDSSGTNYNIDVSNPWSMWIEDIGPLTIAGTGGTGAPSGGSSITTKYLATASQSYKPSSAGGGPISSPDGLNNMYQGTLSGRTNGQEFAVWTFDPTVVTDLAGATITSAQLWMYCTGSSGASGGAFIGYTADTSPAPSYPSGVTTVGTSPGNQTSNWPVPGWGSVDVTGGLAAALAAGARSVWVAHATIDGSASFYGFGTTAFKPYLQVTYTP